MNSIGEFQCSLDLNLLVLRLLRSLLRARPIHKNRVHEQFSKSPADKYGMTRPRPVFAGDTIHIQRRTRDGRFFLVPHRETLQLVKYAYAVAANKFKLKIHALCVMSTHVHVIATDPLAQHPDFTASAHRIIALGLKEMYGIEGSVWRGGGVSVQRLVGRDAIIESLAYVRLNPVAAGCVGTERAYPGVYGADDRDPLAETAETIARPACFGEESVLPDEAVFRLTPPPLVVEELGKEKAAREIAEAVERHRKDAQNQRKTAKRRFFGMKRVLATDIWTRSGELKRTRLNPTYKGVIARAIQLAHQTYQAFLYAYQLAMGAFKEGQRDTVFPAGTYRMRLLGCEVARTSAFLEAEKRKVNKAEAKKSARRWLAGSTPNQKSA